MMSGHDILPHCLNPHVTLLSQLATDASPHVQSYHVPLSQACESEQAAWRVLGYTQVTWDNVSGKERKPLAARKLYLSFTRRDSLAVALRVPRALVLTLLL